MTSRSSESPTAPVASRPFGPPKTERPTLQVFLAGLLSQAYRTSVGARTGQPSITEPSDMTRPLAAAVALALLAGAAGAAPAPRMGITSFAQLKTPLPYPYDEKADASAAVATAKARAVARHR